MNKMDAKFLLVDFLQLILNQVFKRWSIKFKIEFFVTFFIALWGERKNINMHLEMNQTIYRKISNITKDMSLYFSNTLRIAPVIDSTAYCPEIYQFFDFWLWKNDSPNENAAHITTNSFYVAPYHLPSK